MYTIQRYFKVGLTILFLNGKCIAKYFLQKENPLYICSPKKLGH